MGFIIFSDRAILLPALRVQRATERLCYCAARGKQNSYDCGVGCLINKKNIVHPTV